MQTVQAKAYLSATLVLLALDWEDAPLHDDFTGFAIRRTPGFRSADGQNLEAASWLPNRLSFHGAVAEGQPDFPSNIAPIQKFMWWDNRIDTPDVGSTFTYEIWPVLGAGDSVQLQDTAKKSLTVTMPSHVNENGIGTWFNRAVVRSQAFRRICDQLGIAQNAKPAPVQDKALRTWLGNGMEAVVPDLLDGADAGVGAIYHLTDSMFIIPAFQRNQHKPLWMVYDAGSSMRTELKKTGEASPNQNAIDLLGTDIMHTARTHTSIMHNKFIAIGKKNGHELAPPGTVTMGSANYTTEGLTEQANLIHVIESPSLAQFYLNRANLLLGDPTDVATKKAESGWSEPITVGKAKIRVNFSPEPGTQKTQIDTIVQAIKNATNSVLFCLFSPTDSGLRNACFGAGDRGLMMFGLVNHIVQPKPAVDGADPSTLHADQLAALELLHRSKDKRDVIDANFFDQNHTPPGFETEFNLYPGSKPPPYPPVIIHHKFILIDAETDHPIIYTGSANMSENSEHHNDENLLEISGDTALSAVYMAEFMRLYEHYRARAIAISIELGDRQPESMMLQTQFAQWGAKYFKAGTLEYKSRLAMV